MKGINIIMLLPIIFTLINLSLLPIFILLIKRSPLWVSFIFLLAIIPESIFVSFYTLISFGGAFGPGILAFCASALIVPVIFVAWLIMGLRLFPQLDQTRRMVYGIGGIIILLAQAAPILGNYGIGGYCDAKAKDYGNGIVEIIQRYQEDKGAYPEEIANLVPNYLPSAPAYNCMGSLGLQHDSLVADYEIKQCQGKPALATQSADGSRDIWYDFETGQWLNASFFDSGCF
jgi:hypothetical protein